MNTPKDTQKRAKVHSLADALSDKVERASRSLGFEPTNEIAPVIDIKAGEQLLWIDVDLIEDNPFQPRTDYPNEAQLDLIRTINADGQLMPIGVRPHSTLQGRFQARFGHRRKYAVSTGAFLTDESGEERRIYANAGVKQNNPSSYIGQIWCVVRPVSDAEMRREAWQENSARLDLPIMDQARFFVETRAALSEGQIRPASWQKTADFLGEKDRVNVFRVGSLLDLPKPMQEALEIGPRGEKPMLNERHGRALLLLQTSDGAESHKKAQRELFREIKRYLLSGAEAERRAKERRQFLAEKTPSGEDLRLFDLQKRQMIAAGKAQQTSAPVLRSVPASQSPQPQSPQSQSPQPQSAQSQSPQPQSAQSPQSQSPSEPTPTPTPQKERGNDRNAQGRLSQESVQHGIRAAEQTLVQTTRDFGFIYYNPDLLASETAVEWIAALRRAEREARALRGELEGLLEARGELKK